MSTGILAPSPSQYSFNTGGSKQITATELVISMYDSVEAGFYDAIYPEILWRAVIPPGSIKTDINPGAQNYVYRSRDIKGMGQFINGDPANIPRVGQIVGQVSVPILDAAVGSVLTDSEVERAQFGMQTALVQDYGEIMKMAAEYHIERTFFYGNAAANFQPFLSYPEVPIIIVADLWDPGNPNQMVVDVNMWLTEVWKNSKTIHLPDTVFLPPAQFSMLTTAYVIGGGTTGVAVSAMEYLRRNNIYTANTGNDLNIRVIRYLEGAGNDEPTSPAAANRAIIMEWNDRNFVLPFPRAYQLEQPIPIPLGVSMYARYNFGSFNVRYPMAMAYADGF